MKSRKRTKKELHVLQIAAARTGTKLSNGGGEKIHKPRPITMPKLPEPKSRTDE